jgi:hypothetical protein
MNAIYVEKIVTKLSLDNKWLRPLRGEINNFIGAVDSFEPWREA